MVFTLITCSGKFTFVRVPPVRGALTHGVLKHNEQSFRTGLSTTWYGALPTAVLHATQTAHANVVLIASLICEFAKPQKPNRCCIAHSGCCLDQTLGL